MKRNEEGTLRTEEKETGLVIPNIEMIVSIGDLGVVHPMIVELDMMIEADTDPCIPVPTMVQEATQDMTTEVIDTKIEEVKMATGGARTRPVIEATMGQGTIDYLLKPLHIPTDAR